MLWISTGGPRGYVKKYTWTVDAGGVPTVTASSITTDTLDNPYGLAYDGPRHYLYVAEAGTGAVKWYDPSRPSSPLGSFGRLQTPGPVAINSFQWKGIWANPGVAVNGRGGVIVTDHGNQRVQWLNSTGTALRHSYGSDYAMFLSVNDITPATHQVFSRGRLYQVNNADHTWTYAANYYPNDLLDWSGTVDGGGVIRTLNIPGVGNRDFVVYYYLEDQVGLPKTSTALYGVSIYALEPGGMRKSVLIADFNSGGQALADGHVYTGGLQIWTDNNGNGAFDPGEWVSSEDAHAAGNSDVRMDAGGNLWFGRTTDDRGRLVLSSSCPWQAGRGSARPTCGTLSTVGTTPSMATKSSFPQPSPRELLLPISSRLAPTARSTRSAIRRRTGDTATAWPASASPIPPARS